MDDLQWILYGLAVGCLLIALSVWADIRYVRNRSLYIGDEAKRDQHTTIRRRRLKALQVRFGFRRGA